MRGIFAETIVEFFDRRQHWLLLFVSLVAMSIIYMAVSEKIELVENDITTQSVLVQSAVNSFSIFMTVISALAVASIVFLIPRIAQKGRVEFYLSKPITTSTLFYGKLISIGFIYGIFILFCGAMVAGELVFLKVIGIADSFYVVLIGFAVFFVWFSVTSFVGFVTRSVSMSFAAFAIIWVAQLFLKNRASWSGEQIVIKYVSDVFYYILPKSSEMSAISVQLASGGLPANYLPVFTSMVLAGILIYASSIAFTRRDF